MNGNVVTSLGRFICSTTTCGKRCIGEIEEISFWVETKVHKLKAIKFPIFLIIARLEDKEAQQEVS